jgi:hypothetical protein
MPEPSPERSGKEQDIKHQDLPTPTHVSSRGYREVPNWTKEQNEKRRVEYGRFEEIRTTLAEILVQGDAQQVAWLDEGKTIAELERTQTSTESPVDIARMPVRFTYVDSEISAHHAAPSVVTTLLDPSDSNYRIADPVTAHYHAIDDINDSRLAQLRNEGGHFITYRLEPNTVQSALTGLETLPRDQISAIPFIPNADRPQFSPDQTKQGIPDDGTAQKVFDALNKKKE